ncbi:hypothetical protein HanXRQr2_Chr03g0090451 [Helianthus annuus]|uniref:Uncharacterized protein n=1 Tax=Helianthus annuus TaxID=4232 RepID=A0A9K3JD11_HELAN|nr:hypothetical protein HanXRQr2_Chr03g0090451 [Helianthus annuus]
MIQGSCGEVYILRNEYEKFMEHCTPKMKDLVSRDVSKFTIIEYITMKANMIFYDFVLFFQYDFVLFFHN